VNRRILTSEPGDFTECDGNLSSTTNISNMPRIVTELDTSAISCSYKRVVKP